MKNYDEKDLKNVYPEVPEEFHAAVENALKDLDQGKLVEHGSAVQVFEAPSQPQTRRFLEFYGV